MRFTFLTRTGLSSSSSEASISTSIIWLDGGELAHLEERTELGGTKEVKSSRISEESDPGVLGNKGDDDDKNRNASLSVPSFSVTIALAVGVLNGVA